MRYHVPTLGNLSIYPSGRHAACIALLRKEIAHMLKTEVKLSNLAYLIVYVKDTDKTKAFYRDMLGMKIKVDSPDWVELETQGTTLALHKHDTLPTGKREGLSIPVFHVEDIYAAYEALKAKGIKF